MKLDRNHGPRRIVCLTEETTETLHLLGEQQRIVGISGFTVRPPEAGFNSFGLHSVLQGSEAEWKDSKAR